MLTAWQTIKEILVSEVLGDAAHLKANNQFFVFLRESDPSSVTPNIRLFGIPENSILIHADNKLTEPCYLDDEGGMRKRCDYILLTKINGKDTVICLELKSTSFSKPEVISQLKGADCLLEFLSAVAEKFKGCKLNFNPDKVARRYVLIYVPDKPTKFSKNMPQPRETHCQPTRFFAYPAIRSGHPLHIKCADLVNV